MFTQRISYTFKHHTHVYTDIDFQLIHFYTHPYTIHMHNLKGYIHRHTDTQTPDTQTPDTRHTDTRHTHTHHWLLVKSPLL